MTRSRGLLEDWRLKRKVLGSKKKFVSEVNKSGVQLPFSVFKDVLEMIE